MNIVNFKRTLLFYVTAIILYSCNDELQHIVKSNQTPLTIDVGITETNTRAIVKGTTFAEDTEIGISVVDESGTTYDSQDYKNIKFTAITEDGTQKWNPDKQILLSGTDATLYAYHPYQQNTDLAAISVDMTEEDQKDWMYATPIESLSDAKANAQVNFNHALINFQLTFIKENYSGKGNVTAISIFGGNIATGGTLNATSGSFTAFTGKGNKLSRSVEYTLTESTQDATTFNIMAVPADTQGDLTVCLTVDGNNYTCKSKVNELLSGKSVIQSLKLTDTGLKLISLSITDWIEDDMGEVDFLPNLDEKYALTISLKEDTYSDYEEEVASLSSRATSSSLYYIFNDEINNLASLVKCMTVDGKRVTPAHNMELPECNHVIKIWFNDESCVPDGLFAYTTIDEVSFPEGITSVGEKAFKDSGISGTLYIPATLTSIGNQAFVANNLKNILVNEYNPKYDSRENCNALMETATDAMLAVSENVIIPEETKRFGDYLFYFQYLDGIVSIPEGIEYIGDFAFFQCWNIESDLVIPDRCTYIGESAFANIWSGLSSLKLGSSVEIIGDDAFNSCEDLTGELIIPNSVKYIGKGAFSGTDFTKLTMGSGIEYIGSGAFEYNYHMTGGITLPETMKEIGDYTFSGCKSLTGTLTIPNSVVSIGKFAFKNCENLSDIVFGSNVESIGESAFLGCKGLNGNLTLTSSIKSIGQKAFESCNIQGELYIPANIESIGVGAFTSNQSITSIRVDEANPYYDSGNGCNVIIEKATATLLAGCNYSTIPTTCKVIGESAFWGCKGLTDLTIPEGVTSINSCAFQLCTGLTELVIPESMIEIGYSAFDGCSNLTTITFGSNVKSIYSSFDGCSKINTIYAKMKTAATLKYQELSGSSFCTPAKYGTLYVPKGATGYETWMQNRYAYLGYYNWTKVEIDDF